jgi:hypothetical protein
MMKFVLVIWAMSDRFDGSDLSYTLYPSRFWRTDAASISIAYHFSIDSDMPPY